MNKLRYLFALATLLWCEPLEAQLAHGFTPCAAFTLAVSNSTGNVQLSKCGPSVILMNITSQEAFFNYGSSSTTAATTSSYSIPGGAYMLLQIPNLQTNAYYLAGITSSSTTTFRILVGSAQ